MRLIHAHVKNFGKLKNAKFDLSKPLIELKEENGWGKTTLATFIASMFFGLPTIDSELISENARRHYNPWQGGDFGGSLTFELAGKQYIIQRDFSSEKESFSLTDAESGKPVTKLDKQTVNGDNLGEVLFGINKSSYERSAYIPQGEISVGSDKTTYGRLEGGLTEKLRHLINATDANNNLGKAVETLTKEIKLIDPTQGGKLSEVEEILNSLDLQIAECKKCEQTAQKGRERTKALQSDLEKCKKEIARVDIALRKHNEDANLFEQQQYYKKLTSEIEKFEEMANVMSPFFRGKDIDSINLKLLEQKVETARTQQQANKELHEKTLATKIQYENAETAYNTWIATKNLLELQLGTARDEKAKAEAEIASLSRTLERPRNKQLTMLSYVFSLGIAYILAKRKEAQIEARQIVLQKMLNQNNAQINNAREQLMNLSPVSAPLGDLSAIYKKLKDSDLKTEKAVSEADEMLAQFGCKEQDLRMRLYEVTSKYAHLRDCLSNLKDNKLQLEKFLSGKDEAKLRAAITVKSSYEKLANEKRQLENQKDDLIDKLSELRVVVETNAMQASDLPTLQTQRNEAQAKQKRLQDVLRILNNTKSLIQSANEKLADEYLTPLKRKSQELVSLFDPKMAKLDFSDTKVLIKAGGKERDLDYFSLGCKEMISICMRFALIDTIFKNKNRKPCVILDDPFINLDDDKLNRAKDFVRTLSQTHQIVYLTCHESRRVS